VRLFTGIALPEDVINTLKRLLDALRPAGRLRWSTPYNLHVTIKFIGEWPQDRLDELQTALPLLGEREPIPIAISGIGWFPNPHSPRVLFVGVDGGEALARLAADTEDVTAKLGIERERRAYHPHLTLARIRDAAVPMAPIRHVIAGLQSTDFGKFRADAFQLYQSQTGPAGSIYTQLADYHFKGS
jgi:2'-5' RNA ligase